MPSLPHPKRNDSGDVVVIAHPHKASPESYWADPAASATATPGCQIPADFLRSASGRQTSHGSVSVTGSDAPLDGEFLEPHFVCSPHKQAASGAVVIEPEGRVWIVSPTNGFGGYTATLPKGRVEHNQGLSLRQTAIKEVFEETGLIIGLTGFLGDVERSTTTTRYYWARRVGGNPAEMGWESQAVHLVPVGELSRWLTGVHDRPLVVAITEKTKRS